MACCSSLSREPFKPRITLSASILGGAPGAAKSMSAGSSPMMKNGFRHHMAPRKEF
jgi:hypothetical protein